MSPTASRSSCSSPLDSVSEKSRTSNVTVLLERWRGGDARALDDLLPLVYDELRRLARRRLRGERSNHTLAPTELVHEAYGRLFDAEVPWHDRAHFFAVAARTMRRVLVDHARTRAARKRGGDLQRVTLEDATAFDAGQPEAMLALHAALEKLETFDERKASVLELHFFSGLSYDETAEALGISAATVDRDLRLGKAWLQRELGST